MRSARSRAPARHSLVLALLAATAAAAAAPRQVPPEAVREVRLLSAAHLPRRVVMVLSEWTPDEVQAMLEILEGVNRIEGWTGREALRLHVVLENRALLETLDLEPPERAALLELDSGFETDDLWMQDFGEVAAIRTRSAAREVPAVLDVGRGRGLAGFPAHLAEALRGVHVRVPSVGTSADEAEEARLEAGGEPDPFYEDDSERDGDYGGNIEVTPDGLLVLGSTTSEPLRAFFEARGYADRTLVLDTSWLDVGHVDEFVTFLPAPEHELGYVVVRADPLLGLHLLAGLADEERARDLDSMGEVAFARADLFPEVFEQDGEAFDRAHERIERLWARLRAKDGGTAAAPEAEELLDAAAHAAAAVDAEVERLLEALRLHRGDDVEVPVLSFPTLSMWMEDGGLGSILPEMVNLVSLGRHLVIPDPLLGVFREHVRAAVENAGFHAHFLPGLTYHDGQGQLHCATNVIRDRSRVLHPRYEGLDSLRPLRPLPRARGE